MRFMQSIIYMLLEHFGGIYYGSFIISNYLSGSYKSRFTGLFAWFSLADYPAGAGCTAVRRQPDLYDRNLRHNYVQPDE